MSLRAAIASGRFVVTAEIGPPRGVNPGAIETAAQRLRGWVDAANVTDNQGAHVRLSSLAGSVLAARSGVEPVMQLTCRDRNRIALQSDLISAATLGIPNVLLLTGDPGLDALPSIRRTPVDLGLPTVAPRRLTPAVGPTERSEGVR